MSASDHLSRDQFPPALHAAVSTFAAEHPEYSTPQGAAFQCQDASEAFQIHARNHGIRPVGRMSVDDTHTVNTTHGHVIDWTARQYDPQAAFPHVEPVRSFRSRYQKAERD